MGNIEKIYQRTEALIGRENLAILKKAKVCIIGIGGVGSYTLEALARIGIGHITIIDNDIIDATNINRQIIALYDNIGKVKVKEAKKRVKMINPTIIVDEFQVFIDEANVAQYINGKYDYVIDAIDSVSSKIAIIKRCKELNIRVISCMGTANKFDPSKIKVANIEKTEMCPLAKTMRKKLKELNISKVKVVFSTEQSKKSDILGSVSYVPSTAGLIIAKEVVEDLLKK